MELAGLAGTIYSRCMLDVTRLRVLVAVARCGSVTAAARALNYAQPSVSHHLARLEAETGTKLIQRAGRGIRLTDAGRLLAERAAEIIGRLDAAENELAAYTGLRAGRLRLAAFPSALGTIVPAAAALLRDQQPGVDLRLTEAEPPEALRMLRAGYVDVALVFRYSEERSGSADGFGPGFVPGLGPGEDEDNGIDLAEGLRERLLLTEPVHLVTSAHGAAAGPAADAAAGPLRAAPVDRRLRSLPGQPAPAVRAGRLHAEDRLHHRRLHRGPGAGGRRPGGLHAARALPAGRAASRDQDRAAAGRAPVRAGGAVRRPARPAGGGRAHGRAAHRRGPVAALR
jgi:DNA-binding transcriptional LysR family regulator